MIDRPWYRWPENRMTGVVPWWTILRRLIFLPFLLVGMYLTFLAVLGGYGLHEATRIWRDMR